MRERVQVVTLIWWITNVTERPGLQRKMKSASHNHSQIDYQMTMKLHCRDLTTFLWPIGRYVFRQLQLFLAKVSGCIVECLSMALYPHVYYP